MLISGKYQVESQIGQGSMGVVYKVRHTALDTVLALKVLPSQLTENEDLVKRFYREARVMARLNHPNIARVIDVQRDDALKFHYFVMEFIQGKTLKHYAREQGRLVLSEIVDVGRQVARALDYAHNFAPPVIHRDIKPTNIMVETGTRRVVVMDFGIAKELDETEMTRAGTILGTLKYCPPEQMRHEALDGSADVYALGMVLYELSRGSHPFEGMRENEVMRAVLDPAEFELAFAPGTPPEFTTVVSKALAKDIGQRYRRMGEMLRDLDRCSAAFDLTQLTIDAGSGSASRQDDRNDDDLSRLEEQIHKLEEERQRRRVLQAQGRMQSARDAAVREGAAENESSAELFAHACEAETEAVTHYREKRYPEAQNAFGEAQRLFEEAQTQATVTRLVKNADRLREEVAAARRDADQYGASERATPSYGQALAFQEQADDLWKHEAFREAYAAYGQARNLFENAHDVAYRAVLEEETKAFLGQIKFAREAAISAQAEELASEVFWEAVRYERRGDTALTQSEFTQAQELYRHALEQYEIAGQQAQKARRRRRALEAQAQTRLIQQQAEAAGASSELEAFLEAEEQRTRADKSWLMESYEDATKHYLLAVEAFTKAGDAAQSDRASPATTDLETSIEPTPTEGDSPERAPADEPDRAWRALTAARPAENLDLLAESETQIGVETVVLDNPAAEAQVASISKFESDQNRPWLTATLADDVVTPWPHEPRRPRPRKPPVRDDAAGSAFGLGKVLKPIFARPGSEVWPWQLLVALGLVIGGIAGITAYKLNISVQDEIQTQTVGSSATATSVQRELHIVSAVPDRSATVRVKEGLAQRFALTVEDSNREALTYRWYIDGVAIRDAGTSWIYTPDFDSANAKPKEIKVFVSKAGKTPVSVVWKVAVENVNRGPRLDTVTPSADRLELAPGDPVRFSVTGSDPDRDDELGYRWLDNGRPAGSESSLQFTLTEPDSSHEIVVELFDRAGLTARHMWQVVGAGAGFARNGTPELELAPAPTANGLTLVAGKSQVFSVKSKRSSEAVLQAQWFVDRKKVASGLQWTYTPAASDTGDREIKLLVNDGTRRSSQSWQVHIVNAPGVPHIISAKPAGPGPYHLESAAKLPFVVEARTYDGRTDGLNYRWLLDGAEVGRSANWTFEAQKENRKYHIELRIADTHGGEVTKDWTVLVGAAPMRPMIVASSPEQHIVTGMVGVPLKFAIKAHISPGAGIPSLPQLRFHWRLDGSKVPDSGKPEFELSTSDAGKHRISVVAVSPEGLKSQERSWLVDVQARKF